jgi:NADH-quinone oxidoreductase subunit H
MDWIAVALFVTKALGVFTFFLVGVAYMTWMERKVLGHMQLRYGPKNVGWFGLLQPIADGVKVLFKEDIIVDSANKFLYFLAPIIVIICTFFVFAVIPFGESIKIFGRTVDLVVANIDVGLLFVFAIGSMNVYGIVLAGWSSNNKYSLLGGLRSSAQMISYELTMGLSIIGVLMLAGSLSMLDIVRAQKGMWFVVLQPLGFIVFLISSFAEANRCPFDLPEAESELVAGFHTEYSSFKFAAFYLSEYGHMIVVSGMIVTLFMGGWYGPFLSDILGPLWFFLKMVFFLFLFIWVRATYPRFRYDQLMKFGWKVLLPLALFNILVTGIIIELLRS